MMIGLFTVSYMTWLFGTTNCPDVYNHQKNFCLRLINIVSHLFEEAALLLSIAQK